SLPKTKMAKSDFTRHMQSTQTSFEVVMVRIMFYALLVVATVGAAASTQALRANPASLILQSTDAANQSSGQRSAIADTKTDSQKRGSITGRLIDESGQPIPNAGIFVRKAASA